MSDEDKKVSAQEERATNDGWRPESEWEGDPSQWVDYREFNVRGELMGRIQEQSSIINSQKGQIDEVKTALKDLGAMQDKIADAQYNKLVKQIRKQKAQAIEEGEGETVIELDEQLDELKEQRDEVVNRAQVDDDDDAGNEGNGQVLDPAVQTWLSNPTNQWYNTDARLRNIANTIAAEIAGDNPGMAPGEVLRRMDAEVRKDMPQKFSGKNTVDGGDVNNRGNGSKGKRSFNDLTPDQQGICKRLVKLGTFKTNDEYIEQLELIGE